MRRLLHLLADLYWFVPGFVWASWQRWRGRINYRGSCFVCDCWRLIHEARAGGAGINVIPIAES